MIDQDLVAYVQGLSTAAGNRVHLGNAPQETAFPFVVIRRTGGNTPQTLGGISLFSRGQFSINVIAKDYPGAYPTANAINVALHGFRGTMGSTTVQSSRCVSEPADGSEVDGDKVTRWLTQDFLIVYSS
jgi:hypothetical protein